MSDKKWSTDRIMSILIYLGGLALIFLLIYHLRSYLVPFFAAALVAYLLDPIVDWIQLKIIKNRGLAVVLTLLLLLLVTSLAIFIISPSISKEYHEAKTLLADVDIKGQLERIIPQSWIEGINNYLEKTSIDDLWSETNMEKYGEDALSIIGSILKGVFGLFASLFIVVAFLMYLIFLLISFDSLFKDWQLFVPKLYRKEISRLFADIEKQMKIYFRGQSLIVLCVAILFALGFKIIGLPIAIIFGIMVGLMNYVPYLQTFGMIPAIMLGFLQAAQTGDNLTWIIVKILLVFAVVQLIQDIFLTPKIMGDATGLNPAIILLSLTIWGGLFGVVGMIIALPMTSLIVSYYKFFILEHKDELLEEANREQ